MARFVPTVSTKASETNLGAVELATQAEVDAGTDAERVITPATDAGSPRNPLGKQTIGIPAAAWLPTDGAAGPELTTIAGTNLSYRLLLFDGASTERAFFAFPAPKGSDETVSLDVVVVYEPRGTSSGNVVWGACGLARGDGDTTDATLSTVVTDTSAAGSVAGVTQFSGTMTFAPSGPWSEGDTIHMAVERQGGDAADTNTDDCGIHEVRVLYTINAANDS